MSEPIFKAMLTAVARRYQRGEVDAYGLPPERRISDGNGVPCRHCLKNVEAGRPYLILAHRPFQSLQPYAETGPIFLCADACERHPDTATIPAIFARQPQLIVRGYGEDERIVYGTGQIVPGSEPSRAAAAILARPEIAFVHVRSARNNCFQCRIERGA
jgi:hypothetical protein